MQVPMMMARLVRDVRRKFFAREICDTLITLLVYDHCLVPLPSLKSGHAYRRARDRAEARVKQQWRVCRTFIVGFQEIISMDNGPWAHAILKDQPYWYPTYNPDWEKSG